MYPLEAIIYQATNQLDKIRIIYSHLNKKNYNFYTIFSSNWFFFNISKKKKTQFEKKERKNEKINNMKKCKKKEQKTLQKKEEKIIIWKIKDWLVYGV